VGVVTSVWTWLVEKEVGLLPAAGVMLALAVSLTIILLNLANRRKANAETKKVEAETRAIERQQRNSHRERVRDCAGDILRSVSAMVDELFATFGPFALWVENVDKAKLAEAIRVAQRFRAEQRYRAEIEKLISEFAALGARETDPAVAQLLAKATALLMKVSEKKMHVEKIEAEGLTREAAAGVASWLGEIRELRAEIGSLVGEVSAYLSLAMAEEEEEIDRAA
jgi:uncharacterized membrane protein